MSSAVVPGVIVFIVGFGLARGVPVFDLFLEGAKDGIATAVKILPALVGLVTAVGMFRASGGLDLLTWLLAPIGKVIGLPREVLPLALMRPVSGSGAMALFNDLLGSYGPDGLVGRIASVMMGSTETTFYTIALYYGAAGVKDTRHSVAAALTGDVTGFFLSALAVRLLLGPAL